MACCGFMGRCATGGGGGTSLTGLGTDNRLARWDGTDTLQSSGWSLDDSDTLTAGGDVDMTANYMDWDEIADPGAPATGDFRLHNETVGGSSRFVVRSTGQGLQVGRSGSLYLPSQGVYLDGDEDSYIIASNDDEVSIFTSGTERVNVKTLEIDVNLPFEMGKTTITSPATNKVYLWNQDGGGTNQSDLKAVANFTGNEITLVNEKGTLHVESGDLMFTEKADHSETPSAGGGYLWVRSDTPNVLVFTNDAGTDTVLGESLVVATAAAGSDVTTLSLTGLDGDTDEDYLIIGRLKLATAILDVDMEINGAGTNLTVKATRDGGAATTDTAGRIYNAGVAPSTTHMISFELHLHADRVDSGTRRSFSGTMCLDYDSTIFTYHLSGAYLDETSNITSIDFTSTSASGILTGSEITIRKLSA